MVAAPAIAHDIKPRLLTNLCYGAMMSLAIGVNLLPIFLVSIQHSFNIDGSALNLSAGANQELSSTVAALTQEELGRLGAFTFSGLVAAILITGPMADRFGAKLFALAGNVLLVIGLILTAWSPSYAVLLWANFVLGFGAGVLDMVLSPVVSAINPENRSASMNWLHSFYCVGATLTVLAGTAALQCNISWRTASLLLIPLPAILIFALAAVKFPALTSEGETRTPFLKLLGELWFVGALAAIFLGGATELGMAQWLPAYAEIALKYPQWVGGAALFFFSICMAIGRMGIGALSTKLDSCTIMSWGCALSVILFLLGSFCPIKIVALIACILAGLTGSCLWPTMLAITADKYPNGGATMFGALASFGNAGGIFMPWLVGLIADKYTLHWGLAISALAPLLMLPIVLALGRALRSAPASVKAE